MAMESNGVMAFGNRDFKVALTILFKERGKMQQAD
jgi:hypothetical protein